MVRAIRADYAQDFLLPPSVEDWVDEGHPARFVRDFVDHLDLEALGFEAPEAMEGRPRYGADLLLKVMLYGFFCKIRSFRALERACHENLGMVFLTGANEPDHNTLWRFWKLNRDRFKKVFRNLVYTARCSRIVGLSLHAVDGTKVHAQVSDDTAWHAQPLKEELEQIEKKIEERMAEMAASGVEGEEFLLPAELPDAKRRQEAIEASLKELEEVDRNHLHPADKDARMMKTHGQIKLAYNAQVVADAKSGLIVAEEVVNAETDDSLLVPMIEEVARNVGEGARTTVADTGYCSGAQVAQAEESGHPVLVSMPRVNKKPYHKAHFGYDAERDVVVCPHGECLIYERTRRGADRLPERVYRCHSGGTCPHAGECTRDKKGRYVAITANDDAVNRLREKQKEPKKRGILKRRGAIVEPVFAWIKEHMGFRRFTVRGLAKVKAQWSLICITCNLRKLYPRWLAGEFVLV